MFIDIELYEYAPEKLCPYICIYCSIIAQSLNMSDREFARQISRFDEMYVGHMDYLDIQDNLYKIGISTQSSLI